MTHTTTATGCMDVLRHKMNGFLDKIHPIYGLLDWQWAGKGVPTRDQIENQINRHTAEIWRIYQAGSYPAGSFYYRIASGGIEVEGYEEEDVDGLLIEVVLKIGHWT